jgi:chromosome segregation ATPase
MLSTRNQSHNIVNQVQQCLQQKDEECLKLEENNKILQKEKQDLEDEMAAIQKKNEDEMAAIQKKNEDEMAAIQKKNEDLKNDKSAAENDKKNLEIQYEKIQHEKMVLEKKIQEKESNATLFTMKNVIENNYWKYLPLLIIPPVVIMCLRK